MKGNYLIANQLWVREERKRYRVEVLMQRKLTDVLPRSKPSGNGGSPLVAIYVANGGMSMCDSECLKQSDALAINLSEAHCPFVYPP